MPTPDTFEEEKIQAFRNRFGKIDIEGVDFMETAFYEGIVNFIRTTIAEARAQGAKEERETICTKIKSVFEKDMCNDAIVYELITYINAISTKG